MSIKKLVVQLEKHIQAKFPEYQVKFYSNRRNFYIHMGLDKSLFSFENYKKLLEEFDCFLREHLSTKFIFVFPPKLIYSTKWKHNYIIYKKIDKDSSSKNDLTWQVDSKFIPKYIPNDLKWYKKDGLDTWYLKNKCDNFINNTYTYFEKFKITNFDLIKNDVSKDVKKQYQTLDHDEIKHYPPHLQEQICSSIFQNAHRKDLHIPKQTIDEHFF